MDGNEHEPTTLDARDRPSTSAEQRPDKPISFDFKLRLGSRESTAEPSTRAAGEVVQLQPIDWDSFTGLVDDDVPREYKTDGDLPSIIVELANKIAGPDTLAQRALRMNALASTTDFESLHAQTDEDEDATNRLERPFPPAAPEIAVATVEDDPMLSAVVGRILEPPPEPVIEPPREAPAAAAPAPAPVAAPTPTPASPFGAAVSAPVEPVPEGPIELPRIVALTPDLPSGEVVQPTHTPPSVPVSPEPAEAPAPVSAPVQMLTGVEAMAIAATTAPAAQPVPAAPVAPIMPLQLAKIERKPGAERPTKPVDFHALLGEAGLRPVPTKRRKKRHPIRVLFKLVVVLGIIGAGLFFGKKYVLDMRWSGELKPYADAVAEARELKWDKPIDVTTLPIDQYVEHLNAGVLGPSPSESELAAEWRAMGLAEGELHLDEIGMWAAAFRPVMYDPIDHVIYQLDGVPDDLRDFHLYEAMTKGLLDQHFGWSTGLDALGRSERDGRETLVDGDAYDIAMQIVDPSPDELERLAADRQDVRDDMDVVIGGAAGYPSELISGPGGEAMNLFGGDVVPDTESRDEMITKSAASDAGALDGMRPITGKPDQFGPATRTRGMVYWYYVLAGRMANVDAWNAAVAWDGDEVAFGSTADGNCVSSTISTVDEPGRLRLLAALQAWAAAAPAEARSTVEPLGSERISVTSCDPGPTADTMKDDPIQPWGLADVEYGLTDDLGLEREATARSCTINALRNFGVLAQIEAGDQVGATTVTDQIKASCATA